MRRRCRLGQFSALARYAFRQDWLLNAESSSSQMVGDAADSPIVEAGDENQFTFGLSKRFTHDVFKDPGTATTARCFLRRSREARRKALRIVSLSDICSVT